MKAHVGIPGNERADDLAKAGTELPDISHSIPPPVKALKPFLQKMKTKLWQKEWDRLKGISCRQTRLWFPLVEKAQITIKTFIKCSRKIFSIVAQWITGFNNLGYHTSNKKEIDVDIPICRLCDDPNKKETVWHIASECDATASLKQCVFASSDPSNGKWEANEILDYISRSNIAHILTKRHPGLPPEPELQPIP